MRQVVNDPNLAARRGHAARRRIQRNFSEDAVATLVRQRLDAIRSRDRLGVLRRTMSAFADGYRDLVAVVRNIASEIVPPGEVIAVVSRGDPELLKIEHAHAWHFPEARPGVYAGCHPADSEAAIAELEATRARGATFLLFPGTSHWWLEHYDGLRKHLDERYRCVFNDPRCAIFDLREQGARRP
jgi:hypothetical protein